MDSLASLALATEAPTDAMLDLPPYSPSKPLLSPSVSPSPAHLLSNLHAPNTDFSLSVQDQHIATLTDCVFLA